MFLENLTTKEEHFLFLKLILCVAFADEEKIEDRAVDFLVYSERDSLDDFKPYAEESECELDEIQYIVDEDFIFLEKFGMKNSEVELIFDIMQSLAGVIRNAHDDPRYHDPIFGATNYMMDCDQPDSKVYGFSQFNEVVANFIKNAEEISHFLVNTLYQDLTVQTLFTPLFKKIFENSSLTPKAKKTMLFELSRMAHRDGKCSDSELYVLTQIAQQMAIDTQTMDELISFSQQINKLYLECDEIVSE